MTPIKCYPLAQYIAAQMWLPEEQRTSYKGTQKAFAEFMGVHQNQVSQWTRRGWIIDDYGQLYSPQRTTK